MKLELLNTELDAFKWSHGKYFLILCFPAVDHGLEPFPSQLRNVLHIMKSKYGKNNRENSKREPFRKGLI